MLVGVTNASHFFYFAGGDSLKSFELGDLFSSARLTSTKNMFYGFRWEEFNKF